MIDLKMTTLTIEVDDQFYQRLEARARAQHRTANDVARDILLGRETAPSLRTELTRSIYDLPPFSVGQVLKPFNSQDDLLEEMLHDRQF
ncbi:MAG: hypothetical protein KF861_08165 [Planctomycetaceae bacterium]|nr:hypothetical protein [Planctomycetaceae bacterium]